MSDSNQPPELTLVVPVYNEVEVLPELHRRLHQVFDPSGLDWCVIFVDDGSRDGSSELLIKLHEVDRRVSVLRLARNFGHQLAITAGLDHARGAYVAVLDADLQDPPAVVLRMLDKARQGYDVVYGVRTSRRGESALKLSAAWVFYRLLNGLSDVEMPKDTGDFRLMSRRALDAFLTLRERSRYVRGMVAWVGFNQCAVPYERAPRYAGRTKYPAIKSLRLAADAAMSFSSVPLRLSILLGFAVAGASLAYAAYAVYAKLMLNTEVGWASIIVAVLALGGAQLVCLGILGEYVGRIYDEVRRRPLYFVGDLKRHDGQRQDRVVLSGGLDDAG